MLERPLRESTEDVESSREVSDAKAILRLVQDFLRETETSDYSREARSHAQDLVEALESIIVSRAIIAPAAWLRARADLGLTREE